MKNLIYSIISVVAIFAIISACSHEIKLTGDKDKPIPINAEIKIHIYQHAASVVDDLQKGLEEDYDDTSLGNRILYYISKIGVSSAYASESGKSEAWMKAKEELAKIYQPTYRKYMKKGNIGENRDGYVTVISKGEYENDEEKKATEEAAKKLNEARKAFYIEDAKSIKEDPAVVCKNYAAVYRNNAKGIWVEVEEKNKWVWKKIN